MNQVHIVLLDEKCNTVLKHQINFLQQLMQFKDQGLNVRIELQKDKNVQDTCGYFGQKVVYGQGAILSEIEQLFRQKASRIQQSPQTKQSTQNFQSRHGGSFQPKPKPEGTLQQRLMSRIVNKNEAVDEGDSDQETDMATLAERAKRVSDQRLKNDPQNQQQIAAQQRMQQQQQNDQQRVVVTDDLPNSQSSIISFKNPSSPTRKPTTIKKKTGKVDIQTQLAAFAKEGK